MFYKIIENSEGGYICKTDNRIVNLEEVQGVLSPFGWNIGYEEFETIEMAMEYFNVERINVNN